MTVIIDTGCANLASVKFALERLDAKPIISKDADQIRSADRLILPGVGSAQAAMVQLAQRGLLPVLKQVEQPMLGICLGMQLLGEYSEEGNTELTGLLPTRCAKMETAGQPLPHMGWNTLTVTDHPLFSGINDGDYVYFVHSYAVPKCELTLASCDYGKPFSAAIGINNGKGSSKGNLMGVQFHPERSGKVGAQILKNFLEFKG